jgi:tetratricopeptide (TPR) repeat protein
MFYKVQKIFADEFIPIFMTMNKIKKSVLPVIFALIALGAIVLSVKLVKTNKYKNQIPELPDVITLSTPLKEQLSHARDKAMQNPSSDNLGMLGMVFHSCTLYEKAIKCYELAIKKDKSKWEWRYYLGCIYKDMGDPKAAIENFGLVIQENPDVHLAWYYLGKAYENLGSEDKATEAFNKIAGLPDNATVLKTARVNYAPVQVLAKFEMARIDLNSKKTDDAEKLLLQIVKTNRSIGPVYRLLGNVYSAKGDSDLSRKYLIRAQDLVNIISIADTLADKLALISRSELYLPGQIDDAARSGNPAFALNLLGHALQYMPEDKYLISKAMRFFLMMNMGKQALPYLDKHISFFRDDSNELVDVANMLLKDGFYSQSLPYFARAVELKPEDNEAQASYALSYWQGNQKDPARLIMKELYEKNKRNHKVLANETAFMIITGDLDKAETFLKIFRQVDPNNAKIPKLAGMIAESNGNQLKAIPLYEESFMKDPEDLETINKLGNLLIEKQMWEKAVKFYRNALDHHPNEPTLLGQTGTLLVSCPDPKQRNTDEGMELAERAFLHISSPSNTMISAARTLAQGYAIKGDLRYATYYINIAINIAQDFNAPTDQVEGLKQLAIRIRSFRQN